MGKNALSQPGAGLMFSVFIWGKGGHLLKNPIKMLNIAESTFQTDIDDSFIGA